MNGYAPLDGLSMYYEIAGDGAPLVVLPPLLGVAGTDRLASLARSRRVITVDLQGHGRTADVPDRPMSLQQNARDVIALLRHLGVGKVDLLGESYGGATALLIALHAPELVRRVATYGATFGPAADAHDLTMLRFDAPPTPGSPCFAFQRERYREVAPRPDDWTAFWTKAVAMQWDGFTADELAALRVPVLVMLGDRDFVRLEHAVAAYRRLPQAELAVIPDAGHFALSSEPERVLPIVEHFLAKPDARLPVATASVGYQPGATR